MNKPVAYQWCFDPSGVPEDSPFTTISVGVFQWIPRSSGKGLKQSKTIRVCGYAAERDKVYEKALELCERLNGAGARADAPPGWLQKQYSVPKPAGMAIERRSSDLTASQVRALRLRVMKEELFPLGFVKGEGGAFVQRRGEQIHLIHFDSYGGEFTASLAFHFTFVPPLFQKRPVAPGEFGLLDCAVRAGGGVRLPEHRKHYFRYGEDRDELWRTLQRCAAEGLLILDEFSERWSDLGRFQADLRSDADHGWYFHQIDLVGGCLALRLGSFDEAERRMREWISGSRVHADSEAFATLMKNIEHLRSTPANTRSLLCWVDERSVRPHTYHRHRT